MTFDTVDFPNLRSRFAELFRDLRWPKRPLTYRVSQELPVLAIVLVLLWTVLLTTRRRLFQPPPSTPFPRETGYSIRPVVLSSFLNVTPPGHLPLPSYIRLAIGRCLQSLRQ